jgi:hypothetical protein
VKGLILINNNNDNNDNNNNNDNNDNNNNNNNYLQSLVSGSEDLIMIEDIKILDLTINIVS